MLALGKRKFDVKLDDVSIKVIKKPKQDFQSLMGPSSFSLNPIKKEISLMPDLNKNGANKVIHLKIMKPPASLPTLSTLNSTSSSTRSVTIKSIGSNNTNIGSNNKNIISSKSVTLLSPPRKPFIEVKPKIVPNFSSPKTVSSLTSFRISKHASPLNSITNIVVPIKQEKPSELDATQKKKECIIKPLNLPKNFFLKSNTSNVNATAQGQGLQIFSVQNIKTEKNNHMTVKPHKKIIKLKLDESLQPVRSKEPMMMMRQQEFIQPELWYDCKEEHFNAFNFPTDSPMQLLKNLLVTGNYLPEEEVVNYSYHGMDTALPEGCTMRQCGYTDHVAVDIKFVFNKDRNGITSIIIFEITPSTVNVTVLSHDDQNESSGPNEFKRRKNGISRKRKDKNNPVGCGRIQLWQFLLTTLLDRQHTDKIEWMDDKGEFKFCIPNAFANVWGTFKGKRNMTYNNLSRAIRYYYEMGIMSKVRGYQFRYRFTLDIKATTGYTFAELRNLYENTRMDPQSPEFGRYIALRELLSSPISAQTNPKKVEDADAMDAEDLDADGLDTDALDDHKTDFDDDLSPEQSFYGLEDQLASSALAHLLPSGDEALISFSLEDPR